MAEPIWFDVDDAMKQKLDSFRNKSVRARSPLPPTGLMIEGIGKMWARINGPQTQGAVSILFDCTRQSEGFCIIDLKPEQVGNIVKSDGDVDFIYVGDLVPAMRVSG